MGLIWVRTSVRARTYRRERNREKTEIQWSHVYDDDDDADVDLIIAGVYVKEKVHLPYLPPLFNTCTYTKNTGISVGTVGM